MSFTYMEIGARTSRRILPFALVVGVICESPRICRGFEQAENKLIEAIGKGNSAAALRELQEPGLNVNAQGGRALYEAVRHQLTDVVRALLTRGADPNRGDHILANAVLGRNTEIPGLLLAHGADPNIGNPLQCAVEEGKMSVAAELIRNGADVNYNDYVGVGTALLTAAENDNREMVKLLLKHGADPTIEAKFHDPPLQSTNDPEIKRMLQVALRECNAGTRKCGSRRLQ
jgi:ankyrin repeat protein